MNLEEYLCREEGFSPVEAGGIIMAGKVLVNDQVCQQKHYALRDGDRVRVKYERKKYATRSPSPCHRTTAPGQDTATRIPSFRLMPRIRYAWMWGRRRAVLPIVCFSMGRPRFTLWMWPTVF